MIMSYLFILTTTYTYTLKAKRCICCIQALVCYIQVATESTNIYQCILQPIKALGVLISN